MSSALELPSRRPRLHSPPPTLAVGHHAVTKSYVALQTITCRALLGYMRTAIAAQPQHHIGTVPLPAR